MVLEKRVSRRMLLRSTALGASGVAVAMVVGCGDDDDEASPTATQGATATTATTAATPTEAPATADFALVDGWYRDEAVRYYDFGMNSATSGNTVMTAPIYVFITGMNADGTPQFVAGQHNIVDVVPGEDGYSDLWQVMLVSVDASYEPDSIKSKSEIDDSGFTVTETAMLVNCPIVPEGSTLEGGEPLVQGWNKGEAVFYPDFGANPAVALAIWAFITGMNADGTPQFVEGQSNIIDSVPTDDGYSAFWRVNMVTVGEDYEPNSIRSAADVASSGLEVKQTDLVVNCPVTVF